MIEGYNVANSILSYIPNILKALLLLLIAWGVAVLIRNLVKKILLKLKIEEKLTKSRVVEATEEEESEYEGGIVSSISKIAYYLIFILFLPSILDALEMQSVSAPITNMMQNILGFIPRLIGAGIILFVGFFIARLAKDIVFSFLRTIHLDKWYNKLNPASKDVEITDNTINRDTLSDVLSKIVFGVILIPVITMALEALAIRTLTEPILEILNKAMGMIPNIFVAILLVVLGYYIARFISQILEQLLSSMGIEKVYSWMANTTNSNIPRFNISKIIGKVVKILIILFVTVEALSVLNLAVLNTIGFAIISYIPLILSGLIIIGLGVLGGYLIEGLINRCAKSPFTAAIAKYIIIIFAVFMTLEQIKFASTIVNIAFLLVLGGLSVAFALSFGLGGREFAKRQLGKFEEKVEKENNKTEVNNPDNDNL